MYDNATTGKRKNFTTLGDTGQWVERIGRALNGRPNGKGGYDLCDCPVCGGHDNLSIDPGANGGLVVYCHAGCPQESVISTLRDMGLWPERDPAPVTPAERRRRKEEAARRLAKQATERAAKHAAAAAKAADIYRRSSNGSCVASHSYTKKKRLDFGPLVRRGNWKQRNWDALIVPLYDESLNLDAPCSLQALGPNGEKDYLADGKKLGSFHPFGQPTPDAPLYIGEGLATVAAVHHVTGNACLSVCDAPNLPPATETARRLWPGADIIILEDNDDAGRKKAAEAALAVGGKVARAVDGLPGLPEHGDFWDVWDKGGGEAVLNALNRAREPEAPNPPEPQREERAQKEEAGAEPSPGKPGRPDAASALAALALERCVLFHTPDGEAFAEIRREGHREIWPVKSVSFTEWLAREHYGASGKVASDKNLKAAADTLSGKARFDGEQRNVFRRVARHGDAYWIDLCDRDWRAVQVTAAGWSIEAEPPVMFQRGPNMRPLPEPEVFGDLNRLWRIVNIREADRHMVLAWMLECLRPDKPYPILELTGKKGSAKSSTQEYLRALIDPNASNLRAAPKNLEDLFVAARNAHMVSLNNLTRLTPEMQDALCNVATGGGYGTRTKYSTDGETVMDIKRPVILNGIGAVITAQDLVDRTIHIDLPVITERQTEEELAGRFAEHRAAIFGGLLDLFAKALSILPGVKIDPERLPRMADFACLGEAVYLARGRSAGEFLADHDANRADDIHLTLEGEPVFLALRDFLEEHPEGYSGTVGGLFNAAKQHCPEECRFPRTPKGFADAFTRIQDGMSSLGYEVEKEDRRRKDGYHCVLRRGRTTW